MLPSEKSRVTAGICNHLGRLNLDDQLDAGDVEAARRHVRRDQDVKLGVPERLQRALRTHAGRASAALLCVLKRSKTLPYTTSWQHLYWCTILVLANFPRISLDIARDCIRTLHWYAVTEQCMPYKYPKRPCQAGRRAASCTPIQLEAPPQAA